MGISDNKKFIILQEDDKGYSFNNRRPSGYTKIEDKDGKFKISYFVQNINNENTYGLILITNNNSKVDIVSIGEIQPDSNGKIEVFYDFDEELLESICGSGILIKNSSGEIKFPLSGFIPKKKVFNWKISQSREIRNRPFRKEGFLFNRKVDTLNKVEIKSKIKDSEIDNIIVNANDKYEENKLYIDHEENLINENSKTFELENDLTLLEISKHSLSNEGNKEMLKENRKFGYNGNELMKKYCRVNNGSFRYDNINPYDIYEYRIKNKIDKTKNTCDKAKEHIEALKKLMIKDGKKIEKLIESLFPNIYKNKRNIIDDYDYRFFLNILNEYDELNSLNQDGYIFFKVYVDDFNQIQNMKKLDNIKYAIIYYPMITMYPYFKDRGYFIVGLNYDDSREISNLVYGVEVEKGMEKIYPYDGKTGFNKYIYDYVNSKGYHIMEYNYKDFTVK